MSVPAALTAILSLGPAYGLQLHSELGSRLPHRATTNVGQIYSTLDRAVRDGLVARAGETADGLPLYRLTSSGDSSVSEWLSGAWITPASTWADLMDVLLLSATLSGVTLEPLHAHAQAQFAAFGSESGDLYRASHEHFAAAVRAVIGDIQAADSGNSLSRHGYATQRPTRGRRPAAATARN
jgi:DNA-binding PadR family transcriptional regulator